MKIKWFALIVNIIIPLLVGTVAGLISSSSVGLYSEIIRPPLSPPSQIFGIVWPILYVMMGIATYLVVTSSADKEMIKKSVFLYGFSLILNFIWPIVFFNSKAYLLALVIIIVLLIVVLVLTKSYYQINPIAGVLLIPYALWLAFATYLNIGIYLLN